MSITNESEHDALMTDQLRLLDEVALLGGVQIVRHGRDRIHYKALEQKSLLRATEISRIEIRYNITSSGRSILATYP